MRLKLFRKKHHAIAVDKNLARLPPLSLRWRGAGRCVGHCLCAAGSITLACARADHSVAISVTDTGVGIKAEDLDKLFRPFSQIENGMAGLREGTGLGLAITKHLVEAMGGEVRVQSSWGQGSCFGFTLPLGSASP